MIFLTGTNCKIRFIYIRFNQLRKNVLKCLGKRGGGLTTDVKGYRFCLFFGTLPLSLLVYWRAWWWGQVVRHDGPNQLRVILNRYAGKYIKRISFAR